jgi:pimeloyl-ACP methyl ester carboxylesterase
VRSMVLVHDPWADGSSGGKDIPILKDAGYNVTAVKLSLHSMVDDVATVKRAVELQNGSTVLVGHSYG